MDSFGRNLKLLCSQHKSISAVCRALEINRQQFNKYLNGSVRPSRHNLGKIAGYFGIEEADLLSDPAQFAVLVHEKNQRNMGDSRLKLRFGLLDQVYAESFTKLQRYLGYYHTYFHSLAVPGRITKSLICLFEDEGRVYSKGLELLRHEGESLTGSHLFKYLGSVAYLNGSIYIREHETLAGGTISQTTLMPSYHNRVDFLTGLTLGVPSSMGRRPACARIVFEYLGKKPDLRRAIGECGRIRPDSALIAPRIQEAIENEIQAGSQPLYAPEGL